MQKMLSESANFDFARKAVWKMRHISASLHNIASAADVIQKEAKSKFIFLESQCLLTYYYSQPPSAQGLSNINLGLYLDGWLL